MEAQATDLVLIHKARITSCRMAPRQRRLGGHIWSMRGIALIRRSLLTIGVMTLLASTVRAQTQVSLTACSLQGAELHSQRKLYGFALRSN